MTIFKNMGELKDCVEYLKSELLDYNLISERIKLIESSDLSDKEQRHLCKVHIRNSLIKKGVSPLGIIDWLKEKNEESKEAKAYSERRDKHEA